MKLFPSTSLQRTKVKALLLGSVLSVVAAMPTFADSTASAHEQRLDHLLRHDCGSCHGMTMKGGLGPPLLPSSLKERDEDDIVQMILHGNPEKAMPPWASLLTTSDARWIARRLKQGLDN